MGPLTNDALGRVDHIATFCWHPTATSVINHRALRPGGCLSIKVLVADDSDVMRRAIAKLLNEEPSTSLVGEAKGFAEWNDEQAKALAKRFGARVLLDKVNLYSELIPAIKRNSPPGAVSGI
jgi:hypothetical protein